MDPVAFGMQNVANLTDDPPRNLSALTPALSPRDANWQSKVAASNLSSANVVSGRGIAFGFFYSTTDDLLRRRHRRGLTPFDDAVAKAPVRSVMPGRIRFTGSFRTTRKALARRQGL